MYVHVSITHTDNLTYVFDKTLSNSLWSVLILLQLLQEHSEWIGKHIYVRMCVPMVTDLCNKVYIT